MEKVMCIKCGTIGYTASPEQALCSECGGRHKVITPKYQKKHSKRNRILSLTGLAKG